MSAPGFTPGPWSVRNGDTVVGPLGNVVAECCGYSVDATAAAQRKQGGREANAALLAAAPDLFAACKIVDGLCRTVNDITFICASNALRELLRAALAKAEGRQA